MFNAPTRISSSTRREHRSRNYLPQSVLKMEKVAIFAGFSIQSRKITGKSVFMRIMISVRGLAFAVPLGFTRTATMQASIETIESSESAQYLLEYPLTRYAAVSGLGSSRPRPRPSWLQR